MKISDKTCRLCVQEFEESYLESLFEKDEEILIAKKVYDISGIYIEENDEFMPGKICKHCKHTLQISYEFRIICQQSDTKLREILTSPEVDLDDKNIKYEVMSDNESNTLEVTCQIDEWQNDDYSNLDNKSDIEQKVDSSLLNESRKERSSVKPSYKEEYSDKDSENEFHGSSTKDKSPKFTFQMKWCNKYNWLKPGKTKKRGLCLLCNTEFLISSGEKLILKHAKKCGETSGVTIKSETNNEQENEEDEQNKKLHSDPGFIMCEICGNKYPTKRHLKRHLKYHSDVLDYECEICQKKFREMMQLKRHMRTHTGERPYACRFCDKKFGDYSTRIKHERVHKNERPYVCGTCGKAFTYANILKNHILVHTGEKAFKCETCDTSFARKTHLQTHYTSNLHKTRVQESMRNLTSLNKNIST